MQEDAAVVEWREDWRPRKADTPRCGAKTRRGTACQAPGRGRGGRCGNHGGRSTGPRTVEGKRRCVEGRWGALRMQGSVQP